MTLFGERGGRGGLLPFAPDIGGVPQGKRKKENPLFPLAMVLRARLGGEEKR